MTRAQKRRRGANHEFQRRGFRQTGPVDGPGARRPPLVFKANPRDWQTSTTPIPFKRSGYRKSGPMPRGLRILKDDAQVEASKRNRQFFAPISSILTRLNTNVDRHGASSVFALQLIANDMRLLPAFLRGEGDDDPAVADALNHVQARLRPDEQSSEAASVAQEDDLEDLGLMEPMLHLEEKSVIPEESLGPPSMPPEPVAPLVPPAFLDFGQPLGGPSVAAPVPPGPPPPPGEQAPPLLERVGRFVSGLFRKRRAPAVSAPLVPAAVRRQRRARRPVVAPPVLGLRPPPFVGAPPVGAPGAPPPFVRPGEPIPPAGPPPLPPDIGAPIVAPHMGARSALLSAIREGANLRRRQPAAANVIRAPGSRQPGQSLQAGLSDILSRVVRAPQSRIIDEDPSAFDDPFADPEPFEPPLRPQLPPPPPPLFSEEKHDPLAVQPAAASRGNANPDMVRPSARGPPEFNPLRMPGEPSMQPTGAVGEPGFLDEKEGLEATELEVRRAAPAEDARIANLPEYAIADQEEKRDMRDLNNRGHMLIANPLIPRSRRAAHLSTLMSLTKDLGIVDGGFLDPVHPESSERSNAFRLWLNDVNDGSRPLNNVRDVDGNIIDTNVLRRMLMDEPNLGLMLPTRQLHLFDPMEEGEEGEEKEGEEEQALSPFEALQSGMEARRAGLREEEDEPTTEEEFSE